MPYPDFIVAGMTKCGSTSLNHLLRTHPQVHMPRGECHYFDYRYTDGPERYRKILGLDQAGEGKLIGDTSPGYSNKPEVAGRIHAFAPEVKLIFIMRNPARRVFSAYMHAYKKLREARGFEAAMPDLMNACRFDLKLQPYLELFPRENIHVCLLEHLTGETGQQQADAIHDFLGIARRPFGGLEKRNAAKVPVGLPALRAINQVPGTGYLVRKLRQVLPAASHVPKLEPDLYDFMMQEFRPMAQELDRLLGDDISSAWYPPKQA